MALSVTTLVITTIALLTFSKLYSIISLSREVNLTRVPGPWYAPYTRLVLKFYIITARRDSYIHVLHQKYGPYVRISPTEVAITDAAAVREIHRVGSSFPKAPWYQRLVPGASTDENCSVFMIRDMKTAVARRKLFQTAISHDTIAQWTPLLRANIDSAIEKISSILQKEGVCDLLKWFQYMACDNLGEVAFGKSYRSIATGTQAALIRDVEHSTAVVGTKLELPWVYHLLTIAPIASVRAMVDVYYRMEPTHGREAVESSKRAARESSTRPILSRLLDSDGRPLLTERAMEGEAVNIIIAGTDTTALTLSYLVYRVLSNREVENKLRAAISYLPANPTSADLEGCSYLDHVITETLRLDSPVGGSLIRSVPSTGAQLGPYTIPPTALVSTNIKTIHRDASIFPDPEAFNPDRWQDTTPQMKERFMPWGGSNRVCIGRDIAKLELRYTVYKFFTTFQRGMEVQLAESVTKESMRPVEFFVIKPKSGKLEITLKKK